MEEVMGGFVGTDDQMSSALVVDQVVDFAFDHLQLFFKDREVVERVSMVKVGALKRNLLQWFWRGNGWLPGLPFPELILADVVGPGDDFGLGESGGQEKEEEETEHESEKWVGFLGTANQANERESCLGYGAGMMEFF